MKSHKITSQMFVRNGRYLQKKPMGFARLKRIYFFNTGKYVMIKKYSTLEKTGVQNRRNCGNRITQQCQLIMYPPQI